MVVQEMHRPSSFEVPNHQQGGMAPTMPTRNVSIVSTDSAELSTWQLLDEDTPVLVPPHVPKNHRPGGDAPQRPDRRRTVNLENEKKLLALASASAEF